MSAYLIVGNIFSLLSAICIAVSVIKKSKKNLIQWQIWDIIFCIFSNVALSAYAALATNVISLVRNILAYQQKLTSFITTLLFILGVVLGLYVNNRGIIGLLAIISSTSYTIFMYTTKNAQQMRYALVFNLSLWLIHDFYVRAYPSVIIEFILIVWTIIQIFKNHFSIPKST